MAKTNNFGLIYKRERDKGSEATGSQVVHSAPFDSQLHKDEPLSYHRIRQLRNDPTISFLRQVVSASALHSPWTVVAKKSAPSGAKELIEEVIANDKTRTWLIQGSFYGCLDFGWQPYEKVWKTNKDGFQVISRYKQLLQDHTNVLVYTNTGSYAGLLNSPGLNSTIDGSTSQQNFPRVELNERESFVTNFEVEGTNWYGRSITRSVNPTQTYWQTSNDSSARYDRKVAGAHWIVYYPVGAIPKDATDPESSYEDNADIAARILDSLESNSATAIPDEVSESLNYLNDSITENRRIRGKWRIELISAPSSTSSQYTERQKYYDVLKARAFGIPERAVLEGQFGTKAEADTHANVGLLTIDSKHKWVVSGINHHAVDDTLEVNFGEETRGSVAILVAPIVDAKLQILREVYSRVLQDPDVGSFEMARLNKDAILEELDIPRNDEEKMAEEIEVVKEISSMGEESQKEKEKGDDDDGRDDSKDDSKEDGSKDDSKEDDDKEGNKDES